MNTGLFIAVWILANLFAVGIYDVIAFYFLPRDQSVSYWMQRWCEEWPMLALFIGMVMGHLLWPLRRTDRKEV